MRSLSCVGERVVERSNHYRKARAQTQILFAVAALRLVTATSAFAKGVTFTQTYHNVTPLQSLAA